MTPDELRALADALEPMARAPRFDDMNVPALCEWLRGFADAKPVGYATANGLRMLQQDDATVLLYKHDYLIRPDHVPLYAHPAPAVPQAEPIDPHMIVAEDRFPDAQAEPKREPLDDHEISKLAWQQNVWTDGMIEFSFLAFARAVERAAYERAAQECIETAAELRRCADGCTDGRYDWKADGADDCADAIRALGRQHD